MVTDFPHEHEEVSVHCFEEANYPQQQDFQHNSQDMQ